MSKFKFKHKVKKNSGIFKKGHNFSGNQFVWPLKAKKRFRPVQDKAYAVNYVRLSQLDFDRITVNSKKSLHFTLRDQFEIDQKSRPNVMLLRPRREKPSLSDKYLAGIQENMHDEMRLFNQQDLNRMWNTAIAQHENSGVCRNTELTVVKEDKFGICWEQKLGCVNCNYVSDKFKLYKTVQTNTR